MDKKALKILFNTYWSSKGWKEDGAKALSDEDFAYAKKAGVMFDPVTLSHDDVVRMAVDRVSGIDAKSVADAFLASLSTRRLDLRSALGSYAVMRHLRQHTFEPLGPLGEQCAVCGAYKASRTGEDLNILNFERFKWGGVRHDEPLYASFDLRRFTELEPSPPAREDVQILRGIFKAIEKAPLGTTSANLQKHFGKNLKANKAERDILISILGFCGILGTCQHPGYRLDFVPFCQRDLPGRRFVDMAYPACWWQHSDGVNAEARDFWFGHAL